MVDSCGDIKKHCSVDIDFSQALQNSTLASLLSDRLGISRKYVSNFKQPVVFPWASLVIDTIK